MSPGKGPFNARSVPRHSGFDQPGFPVELHRARMMRDALVGLGDVLRIEHGERPERRDQIVLVLVDRLGYLVDHVVGDIGIGDHDQKELFLEDNLPGLLVYRGKTVPHQHRPPKADWVDWFAAIQARYYIEEGRIQYPADDELAECLIEQMVDRGFDVAVSDRLPRNEGEGHAFAFVHRRLFKSDPVVPMVQVFLNTYYPPNQPTPSRCYQLGQAVRAAVESYPKPARVGILGSGGLSHFAIDEPFDREIIRALKEKDTNALKSLPGNKLHSGNSEIRNWITAAGAAEPLPLAWVEYVPAYRSPAGTGTGLCFAAWHL